MSLSAQLPISDIQPIPLAKPSIGEDDIAAVCRVLRSGMLVQGSEVSALEAETAAYLGVKHVFAASNGTATLHMALLALGIGPGDEVLVPAFSYVATANVVEMVGATCIFVDIDLKTFNIDTNALDGAVTARTRAIIPVHEFGLTCDISTLVAWANSHGIAVIEDAACALGSREGKVYAGTMGTVGSFSLHPRKSVTSGEGGLIVTNSDVVARKINGLRNHGIQLVDGSPVFDSFGLNYRLTDFQAALVRGQFKRLENGIQHRHALAERYQAILEGQDSLVLPRQPVGKRHTWQTFHLLLRANVCRTELIRHLASFGIGAGYGAQCIPALPCYVDKYGIDSQERFPHAYVAFTKGLALPMFDEMTFQQVERVSGVLIDYLRVAGSDLRA